MKKVIITVIILAGFAFSFVLWKIYDNKIFSIINTFVCFLASMIQIYDFFNKKDIVSLKEKEIAEKDNYFEAGALFERATEMRAFRVVSTFRESSENENYFE